ncbi:MAG: radical SAM protein [Gammaproteobacteria bacterium]|nr:radical SAM protein [Gammaproteobacteria bacterium]
MHLNYDMPLYRPPSEANNLIIQATLGCSFNQCSFCSMYTEKQYKPRSLNDIAQDIQIASQQQPDTQRIFLADGDALALPAEHLLNILQRLQSAFPRLTRVSCYATPSNILHKTEAELDQLKKNQLSLLYLGIESGSDLILKKITKGASQRGIADALHKAHNSGIKVSGTVILGLGGTQYWQEHIDGTVALMSKAPVSYLSTLQLFLHESAIKNFKTKFNEPFESPDDIAILKEQHRLIANINPPIPVIFRSNHASNALALAGVLPKDRKKLLTQLAAAIAGDKPLRPEYLRGL